MRSFVAIAVALFFLPAALFGAATDSASHLLDQGKVDEVIATLVGHTDADSNNQLCRAYYALGELDHALGPCEKAVALEPSNARYHLWLGRVYGEKADKASFLSAAGFAKKLRVEFERAVQLDPNDTQARTDLAEFYLEAPGIMGGGKDKAIEQARLISKTRPAREHWIYARIAEKDKDLTTAEAEYRKAIASTSENAEAWSDLAIFFRKHNRLPEMEEAVRHATSSPSTPPGVLFDAAENLSRAGQSSDYDLAISLLRRYLASATVEDSPAFKAHYLLGSLLEKQAKKTEATTEFRAALALAREFQPAQQALQRLSR